MSRQPAHTSPLPLVIVTGTHAGSMAAVTVGLQWDLPSAVVVRHHIDTEEWTLTRTVSDVTGTLEEELIDLDHVCVSCAIREDVLPTIERLARSGRWQTIVAHLPVSAEARQLCLALDGNPRLGALVRVASVVAAVRGDTVSEDLLGGATVLDAGAQVVPDDDRGLGEVLSSHIEYADVVGCVGGCDQAGRELVSALARPDATVLAAGFLPGGSQVLARGHDTGTSEAWTASVRRGEVPRPLGRRVWQLDLRADRPLHPDRFMAEIEAIGSGRHRSRGCFWLASRPQDVCAWEGCGGHLNIGVVAVWGDGTPFSRLVITGDWSSEEVNGLADRFQRCVLTDGEFAAWNAARPAAEDGFEPWLGPIEPARSGVVTQ